MSNKTNEMFIAHYGWEHFWYDPLKMKRQIKEYIKGPFDIPKIVCSIPYLIYCQDSGLSRLAIKNGIPDSWAELLNLDFNLSKNSSTNLELIHKKNVNVSRVLRKKYCLYLGQGIPDPWIACPLEHPHQNMNADIRKYISHLLSRKRNNDSLNDSCLCCEKTFLFKCPDKVETNTTQQKNRGSLNCICKDCHGENFISPSYDENCICFQVFHSMLSHHADLSEKIKNKDHLNSSNLDLTKDSETILVNEIPAKQNLRVSHRSTSCGFSKVNEANTNAYFETQDFDNTIKQKYLKLINPKDHATSICLCPALKNFFQKNWQEKLKKKKYNESKLLTEPSSLKKLLISKHIQTEMQPKKNSKTVQTEYNEIVQNKCFQCNVHQSTDFNSNHKTTKPKKISKLCFPHAFPSGNGMMNCPCLKDNNLLIYSLHEPNCCIFREMVKKEVKNEIPNFHYCLKKSHVNPFLKKYIDKHKKQHQFKNKDNLSKIFHNEDYSQQKSINAFGNTFIYDDSPLYKKLRHQTFCDTNSHTGEKKIGKIDSSLNYKSPLKKTIYTTYSDKRKICCTTPTNEHRLMPEILGPSKKHNLGVQTAVTMVDDQYYPQKKEIPPKLNVDKGIESDELNSFEMMSVSRDLFTTKVNSTMMSINERFTYLQKKTRPAQSSLLTIRAKNSAQQQASAKNRRLAMQMERRLSAMAALKIKKKSIRQRLGVPTNSGAANVRDRLSLPARGRGIRGRGRANRNKGRPLRRSQSVQSLQGGTLQRTASMQSLNRGGQRRGRSRSRSRTRARTPSRNRSNSISRTPQRSPSVNRQRRFSTSSFGQPANGRPVRGRRNSLGARNQRLRNRDNRFARNQRGAGNSSRGRGNFQQRGRPNGRRQFNSKRGRGRGKSDRGRAARGGATQIKVVIPTKEELDKQLEQYMANTKSHLDKEIDTYMKESGVNDS